MKVKLSQLIIKVKSFSPEKLFLLFAIPLGLLFLLIHPLGEVPDEFTHFKRAYGITEGAFIPEQNETLRGGSSLPSGLKDIYQTNPAPGTYSEVGADLVRANSDEHEDYDYVTAALYNPVCYFPQVVGIFIGKIFNAPYLIQAYLGRIVNFAGFLILVYLAIKLLPKFKHWLIFLSLLPITLQEAASLSPDALTIGLCFFTISFVLYLAYAKKDKLSPLELTILYLSAAVIGLCKIVYLPILLLYFIIPAERFGSKKQKIIHATAMIVITVAVNLSWLIISSRYLVDSSSTGVDPDLQLAHLISNPFRYLIVLARTVEARLPFYLTSGIGLTLGHFAVNLPNIFLYLTLMMATLILFQTAEHFKNVKPFERAIFIITPLSICLLMFTSLYLQWTAVDAPIVDGVQGRYFLPFLPLLPVIFNINKPKINRPSPIRLRHILIFLAIFDLVAILKIFLANL